MRMGGMSRFFLLFLAMAAVATAQTSSQNSDERELLQHGWRPEVFKTVGEAELKLWYKTPAGQESAGKTPAIVFFYGGGWRSWRIAHFRKQGEHLVKRGMVVVLADYRAERKYGGTPFDCVEDAKSAIRYVRGNAPQYGIDPDRIAAGGGSAGGHLAAATALVPGSNAAGDDLVVSCVPNALVLFNPVIDTSPTGFGHNRLRERWKEISPLHHIEEGAPPNVVFLGDEDHIIPVSTAQAWVERMEAVGTRSHLHLYEGRGHAFFNRGDDFDDTLAKTDAFLVSLGYLEEK